MSLIERLFPVVRHDFNHFDQVFAHLTQHFREMEREMGAMRSQMYQLMPHDMNGDVSSIDMEPRVPIVEEKGETKLKLQFDVHQFKPEEVEVKIMGDNILQVYAKHDEKTESGERHRVYCRQYSLPTGVDAERIHPTLTQDGVLTIEAPAPSLKPNERMVPIEYKPHETKE